MGTDEILVEGFREEVRALLNELMAERGVEIFGKLQLEVANLDTVALLKGNRIFLNVQARAYPRNVLKYVLAHELAHLAVKGHTIKFWEIVKQIYPQYEEAKDRLLELAGRVDGELASLR